MASSQVSSSKGGLNKGHIARAFQDALRDMESGRARTLDFEQYCLATRKAIKYLVYGATRKNFKWRGKNSKTDCNVAEEATPDKAAEKQGWTGTRGILKAGLKPGEEQVEQDDRSGGMSSGCRVFSGHKNEHQRLSTCAGAVPPLNLR